MATTVVNIRTGTPCDVYIGRGGYGHKGYFGNPFRLPAGLPPGSTLDRYREYFYDKLSSDPEFKRRVLELKGKVLGCFCKPHPCHGDIIADYLNNL